MGAAWAAIAFWKRGRHNPKLVYFFCMGAPVFLVYLLQTFRSRVFPNWIAPSVVPLFCLMAIYWDTRWRMGAKQVKAWLAVGLILGAVIVVYHARHPAHQESDGQLPAQSGRIPCAGCGSGTRSPPS